ncbi:LysR family transcriptional regulator [Prauserella muralis]|uniref:LysR family transcriptional regulator n=1 Tax=Prauserella muralis TaxID=588067 RepID=A0A2V4AV10_9PSEU|nr:LysR family transcriptional regulator [Prauserella muralis]PXY19367.1 LysR family transcriptional regulator [Prauserella muralis]TWE29326.1 DNA-binding transcriptional LysR family regulator [Prauserella muralis]
MDLDLAQVRAFVVTAELRNFSRAAERLFVTQQALSKRIGRLESALGARLFVRTNRMVELTTEAERFLPAARELVRANDTAIAALARDDAPVRADLLDNRLSPMFMLRRMAEREPGLRVERGWRGGLAHAIDPLLRGEVEVAFGRVRDLDRELPAELEHRLVRLEPLVALLAPEHPLAGGDVVPMTALREEGIWLPSSSGPGEWTAFLGRLSEAFDVPIDRSGISYDLRHTLEQTRYGRRRVTLAGADMELAPDLNLRVLPFEPSPLFPWSVVWRGGRPRPAVARLLELVLRTSRAEDWCAHDPARCWIPDPVSAGAAGTRR